MASVKYVAAILTKCAVMAPAVIQATVNVWMASAYAAGLLRLAIHFNMAVVTVREAHVKVKCKLGTITPVS